MVCLDSLAAFASTRYLCPPIGARGVGIILLRSESMVSVHLSDELEAKLITEARRRGVDAGQLAKQLLERALAVASVDDALAPFRSQVQESGLSSDQLDALFQEARDEVWKSRGRPQ
jgi:hypothetical protein